MEGRYPRAVMVTLADCVDVRLAAEYEPCYEEVFVAEIEKIPLVTHVHRYENAYRSESTFRGHPRYLTIAEVEHEDMQEARRELRSTYDGLRAKLGDRELRKLDTLYERIGPEFHGARSGRPIEYIYIALVDCTDTNRRIEWNQWYDNTHLPDAVAGPFDTGYRYRAVDLTDPMPHQASPYLSLYETGYSLEELQRQLALFRAELMESDRIWATLLAIHYAGLFKPIDGSRGQDRDPHRASADAADSRVGQPQPRRAARA